MPPKMICAIYSARLVCVCVCEMALVQNVVKIKKNPQYLLFFKNNGAFGGRAIYKK